MVVLILIMVYTFGFIWWIVALKHCVLYEDGIDRYVNKRMAIYYFVVGLFFIITAGVANLLYVLDGG